MTNKLRTGQFPDNQIIIQIDNSTILQTPSEELLGVLISEDIESGLRKKRGWGHSTIGTMISPAPLPGKNSLNQ